VEEVKPVLFRRKKNRFQLAPILRRRVFTRMNCEISGFQSSLIHMGPDII
jgi:hypothetical protein